MKYLVLTKNSLQYAKDISESIWQARYPDEERKGGEATRYYCSYVYHPKNGQVAIAFPDEPLKVHPRRKLQPLVDVIKAPLPAEHQQAIQDHFDNLFPRAEDDEPLTIDIALPSLYSANLKTRSEMEALGWFTSGDL